MAVMTAVVPNMHHDETHQLWVITMAVYAPPPSGNRTSTSDTINSAMCGDSLKPREHSLGCNHMAVDSRRPTFSQYVSCPIRGRAPPPPDSPQPLTCRTCRSSASPLVPSSITAQKCCDHVHPCTKSRFPSGLWLIPWPRSVLE